jgi:hypothetical protein
MVGTPTWEQHPRTATVGAPVEGDSIPCAGPRLLSPQIKMHIDNWASIQAKWFGKLPKFTQLAMNFQSYTSSLQNKMHINDWAAIQALFDKMPMQTRLAMQL